MKSVGLPVAFALLAVAAVLQWTGLGFAGRSVTLSVRATQHVSEHGSSDGSEALFKRARAAARAADTLSGTAFPFAVCGMLCCLFGIGLGARKWALSSFIALLVYLLGMFIKV